MCTTTLGPARNALTRFLLTAWLGVAVVAGGCSGTPSVPDGVTALTIADPREHWARNGFVQLVPPVHLPSSHASTDQVEIWARVPQGGVISGADEPATGAAAAVPPRLLFPPGSVLDRVEYANRGGKRYVVDVRGTRIDAAGAQWFHVYRRGDAGLFGLEWARSDQGAQARATGALVARLAQEAPANRMGEERRAAFLRSVEGKNACGQCHGLSRPTNATQSEHGIVNRGTDASGFFTPWTLLADDVPLERYGGHDGSETDRWTRIRCPAEVPRTKAEDGRARCATGAVPTARYDLPAALAAQEVRALGVCTGRRYLARYLSPELRERFSAVLRECEISR